MDPSGVLAGAGSRRSTGIDRVGFGAHLLGDAVSLDPSRIDPLTVKPASAAFRPRLPNQRPWSMQTCAPIPSWWTRHAWSSAKPESVLATTLLRV
ncbi:MAG: hypothetical protein IPL99_19280 [Candidatus Competibacteraceae bacterium]|nr:hypothetical protein [Candidatus Competibacteraceae bacterium]